MFCFCALGSASGTVRQDGRKVTRHTLITFLRVAALVLLLV